MEVLVLLGVVGFHEHGLIRVKDDVVSTTASK